MHLRRRRQTTQERWWGQQKGDGHETKIANSLIVGMVVLVTVFLGSLANSAQTARCCRPSFSAFFALLIAIQVVPALMLFGVMVKEIIQPNAQGEG